MSVTEQRNRDRVHVMAGSARGRVLAIVAWLASRVAILGGAIIVSQALRADLYTAAKVLVAAIVVTVPLAGLFVAHELRKRAWWQVAGQEDPVAPPGGWQALEAVTDGCLIVGAAFLLTHHAGLGTRYPGAVVAMAVAGFAAAHALVRFGLRRGGSTTLRVVVLVPRLAAAGVAIRLISTVAYEPWFFQQATLGAGGGAMAFALLAIIWRSKQAGNALRPES